MSTTQPAKSVVAGNATTALLTAALAKLCAVLRSLGMGFWANFVESEAHLVSLGQAIMDAAAELSNRSRQARWERKGDDRDAAIADALRCDTAALACGWLTSALRAANGFDDAADADRMARAALDLLAWAEALDVVNAAELLESARQESGTGCAWATRRA